MGNVTLNGVFNRISLLNANEPNDTDSMKGVIHTLKVMIIKSNESSEEMGRRLTAYNDTSANQTFGERLLDFFAKYAPNEIAILSLNSTVFRELMSTKICEVIAQTKSDDHL